MPSSLDFVEDLDNTPFSKMNRFDAPKDASPCNDFDPTRIDDLDEDGNSSLTSQALNADGTPRRPMNAFMIFARRRRPQVSAENQSMRTGEVSKILSKEWNSMPPADKQFYLDQAKILKDNFNAKYPDYVYRRRPNNSRRRRRTDGVDGHSVEGSSAPSDDGSESSPIERRDSTSPHDKTGPPPRNPPFPPSAPPSQYRRPLDNFLPPLGGTSMNQRGDRAWQDPSWSSSPRPNNFGFQTQQSPFYPSSASSNFRGSPTSTFPQSGRPFDNLDMAAPRISSTRMPFDYMGEFPQPYNTTDAFPTQRVSPDLSHNPAGQYNLPPLQKANSIPYAPERLF